MERNVMVDETTEHGSQKVMTEKIGAKEALESVMGLVSRDDAEEFMSNSLDYIKNKMDALVHAAKDLQKFFDQNTDLAVLLDPALVLSFSLMDPDGGMDVVLKNIATKQAADRNYRVEAAFGRGRSVKTAMEHLGSMLGD